LAGKRGRQGREGNAAAAGQEIEGES